MNELQKLLVCVHRTQGTFGLLKNEIGVRLEFQVDCEQELRAAMDEAVADLKRLEHHFMAKVATVEVLQGLSDCAGN